MSTTAGLSAAAAAKTPCRPASLSPRNSETTSGPLSSSSVARASAAAARASNVLPLPGGPYRSTPRGGRTP
eukprot:321114-Chlamydomonas_euryale.AAC.1